MKSLGSDSGVHGRLVFVAIANSVHGRDWRTNLIWRDLSLKRRFFTRW